MSRRRCGFTLIELLLVLLLLGTVMSVIIACFDAGFRVYARVSAFGAGELEAYLAGERMERDLQNAISLTGVPFQGEASAMTFAAVATDPLGAEGLQRLRYQQANGLARSTTALTPAGMAPTELTEQLLAGRYTLQLAYLAAAEAGGRGQPWQENWTDATNLPLAVRITLSGEALAEGPVTRTIALGAPPAEEDP